jgi:flagellar motor switch protein FliN/FliY
MKLSSQSSDAPIASGGGAATGQQLLSIDSAIFRDVRVVLRARLGEATLSVEELLALKAGSVVTLETALNEPIELRLNDALVARGEIVAVGDSFGVRIVEVAQIS